MKIDRIIEQLRRPEAYPHRPRTVEVRQTHISAVFLAGDLVYKVKKPVELGFLDFSTVEKRRHFCREEVRLNRRLAPDVYLGVVPVTAAGESGLRVDGKGRVVDHAVKMRRLPDEATLAAFLERGALEGDALERLGRRIAGFHADAASGDHVSSFGCWEVVAANARENLEQSRDQVGVTVSRSVRERLRAVLEQRLEAHRDLIEARAGRGVTRDTHGDLHLEHVYLFPDREPPRDLTVIDCVEFNERFRYADPVSDMAFLAMDLRAQGRYDLERRFSRSYFRAAGDPDGRALLPFYRSYRAAVRGKVEGMAAGEEEVSAEEGRRAVRRARGHWLLALSELEPPNRRPGLVLLGGLPGTGKSTLARALARRADFRVVSSDRVRKDLAGLAPRESASASFEEGLYTPAWTARTYRACLRRALDEIFQGHRIVVDASFGDREMRRRFLEAGRDYGVRHLLLVCDAPREVVRERLERRDPGASDADWEVYLRAADRWEPPGPEIRRNVARVSTEGPLERSVEEALGHLHDQGL